MARGILRIEDPPRSEGVVGPADGVRGEKIIAQSYLPQLLGWS